MLAGDDPRLAQALGAAVLALSARGEALDAPRGGQVYARSGGQRVPLYGGCGAPGYLAVACNVDGGYAMGPGSYGNSYLQVVGFGAGGVEAYTLLAHGLSDAAFTSGKALAAPALARGGDRARSRAQARRVAALSGRCCGASGQALQ